ncbi:hypothetical protein HOE425_331107 [Hoeflea sp. EC-HK425]|nr:hypothetical protein HOE425_331107 [Hoeflea sp. EC-HK425]
MHEILTKYVGFVSCPGSVAKTRQRAGRVCIFAVSLLVPPATVPICTPPISHDLRVYRGMLAAAGRGANYPKVFHQQ